MSLSYSEAIDWLAEDLWRPVQLLAAGVVHLAVTLAVAVRYSWRMGYAEPPGRASWALVNAAADLVFLAAVLVLVFSLHGAYRWYASSPVEEVEP